MNTPSVLIPERTITKASDLLSSLRPVNVFSHVFVGRDGNMPVTYTDPSCQCGPAYPILNQPEVGPHDHEHHEVSIVLGGHAIHHTALYRVPLKRGDLLVVAPGQVHAIEEIDGLHIIDCVYLTEWLMHDAGELWREEGVLPLFLGIGRADMADTPWVPHHPLQEEEVLDCLNELRGITRELARPHPSHPYMRRCLEKLMITVGRVFARVEGIHEGGALPREVHFALERIEAYAATEQPFRVRDLAEEAGLSANYFTRLFKEATGATPMAYFQRRRVEHACWLLLNTDNSITEIAYMLGYLDPPHFARVFRAHRGLSPRAYRARYRSE